jgi:hypothetical protein
VARQRIVKPGFFKNEVLAGTCAPLTRLFFAGLWCWADREGRLEDRPARLRAEVLPYDAGVDGEAMVAELTEKGFLVRYEVDGIHYLQIVNWHAHQDPHPRETPSEIPACPGFTKGSPKANLRRPKAPPRHPGVSSTSSPSGISHTRGEDLAADDAEHRPPPEAPPWEASPSPLIAFLVETYPDVRDPAGFERAQHTANPGVDLLAEARKARAWEVANPTKAKRNHARFLDSWFRRAQDDLGRAAPARANGTPPSPRDLRVGSAAPSDPSKFQGGEREL